MMDQQFLQVQAGEPIYACGDAGGCAYIILNGNVELCRQMEGGRTRLAELRTGELFGEDGLISEKPRNTDAFAITTTKLRRINGSTVAEIVRTDPDSAILVLKVMLERLRGGKRLRPRPVSRGVILKALTPEAAAALGSDERHIDSLPCRIGRACNDPLWQNEIQLSDQKPFQVSRSHLVLSEESGRIVLYDRGSHQGSWVRGQCIGGRSTFDGPVILGEEECEVVLGHSHSQLRFSLKTVEIEDKTSTNEFTP